MHGHLSAQPAQFGQRRRQRGVAVHPALVLHQVHHHGPAPVGVADQPFPRHADVVEEHLGQLATTAGQRDRSHRHARAVSVNQQRAQPPVAAFRGAGTDQGQKPRRGGTLAGPDLLPVEDEPACAVVNGPATQRSQVAARLRLGEALPPPLVTAHVVRQISFGEFGRVLDDGRSEHLECPVLLWNRQHRRGEFLEIHRPVNLGSSEAARLLRPAVAVPPGLIHAGQHDRVVRQLVLAVVKGRVAPLVGPVQVAQIAPEILAVCRDLRHVFALAASVHGVVDRG